MKVYFARHGQVMPLEFYGDAQFPAGDTPLTNTGELQATYLGKYMKSIGFSGKIYSSPYARALKTAEKIADETGSEIVPWSPMREIVKTPESTKDFTGLTLEQIKESFKHISASATLEYPWWNTTVETLDDVIARIKKSFEELNPREDVLFVGHGASVKAMAIYFDIPAKFPEIYNCCLSMIDTDNKSIHRYMDTAHLPNSLMTMNSVIKYVEDAKNLEALLNDKIEFPNIPNDSKSVKLLHIGDTSTYTYPYYEKLIAVTKPNIIVHTGDIADEIKAGRIKAAEKDYENSLKKMSDILKNSGADQIYVVPGNNDILPLVEKYMDFASIVAPNTGVTINDIPCTLAHTVFEITKKSKWNLYGHGLTGDKWNPDDNDLNNECFFNVMWGPKLFILPDKKVYSYIRPENYKITP